MKILLSVFLFLFVVDYSFCIQKKVLKLPQKEAQDLMHAISVCLPDSGIPMSDLMTIVDGGYIDSKSFKNFLYCCYENAHFIGSDGLVDIEKSVNVFSEEKGFGKAVRQCGEKQEEGGSNKQGVFNFFKCFQDTVPFKLTV